MLSINPTKKDTAVNEACVSAAEHNADDVAEPLNLQYYLSW